MLELCAGVDCIFHFAAALGMDYVAEHPMETMETKDRKSKRPLAEKAR